MPRSRTGRLSSWAAVFVSWVGLGCSVEPRTEVVLVVGTDYEVPTELSQFNAMASGPNMQVQTAGATLMSPTDLPGTLGLVHQGGELGPFDVTITAPISAVTPVVIERRVIFHFQRGRTLQLRVDLVRACESMRCSGANTCEAGVCRPIAIDPSELTPWTGEPSLPDSGKLDGDAGDSAIEDTGSLDGGADAGPLSCDRLYGSLSRYELCEETPTTCAFYSLPSLDLTCDALCGDDPTMPDGGISDPRRCLGAHQRRAGGDNCRRGDPIACDLPDDAPICVCPRSPLP